jgi:acetyltransferase-like isoleucine patch superfamily enzyme
MIYKIVLYMFRVISWLQRKAALKKALSEGMIVGRNTLFSGTQSFGSEPYLIVIGDNCLITDDVKFITHDGSIQVPLIASGENIDDVYSKKSTFGRIKIGNNVFIGVSSIILPGTIISDNSIVAAGSIVKGKFSAGVVVGGNPAKVICTVNEYYVKNQSRILNFTSIQDRKKRVIGFLNGEH